MQRISLVTGGKHFSKYFSIFYILNSKNQVFQSIFLKRYLSNEKNTFADNLRVESTIFLMEKLSFSLKLSSGHFYSQSFIKTVRGLCTDMQIALRIIRLDLMFVKLLRAGKFKTGKIANSEYQTWRHFISVCTVF